MTEYMQVLTTAGLWSFSDAEMVPVSQVCRVDRTQNSLPSGSARITHVGVPCPISVWCAPARRNHSTSACRSSGR
jgi:hypothetical protein